MGGRGVDLTVADVSSSTMADREPPIAVASDDLERAVRKSFEDLGGALVGDVEVAVRTDRQRSGSLGCECGGWLVVEGCETGNAAMGVVVVERASETSSHRDCLTISRTTRFTSMS